MLINIRNRKFGTRRYSAINGHQVHDSFKNETVTMLTDNSFLSKYVHTLNDDEYMYLKECQEYLDEKQYSIDKQYDTLPF